MLSANIEGFPFASVTSSVMGYVPAAEYVCTGGFCRVEVVPSPKSQTQFVIGTDEVEISVKVTRRGAVPLEGVDVKDETGRE